MEKLKPYAKAIIGGLAGGLAALQAAMSDGSVSPAEWLSVAEAVLIGLGVVYAVPNGSKAEPKHKA